MASRAKDENFYLKSLFIIFVPKTTFMKVYNEILDFYTWSGDVISVIAILKAL